MSESLSLSTAEVVVARRPRRPLLPMPFFWSAGIVLGVVVLALVFSGGHLHGLATGWSELYPAP